VSQRAGIVHNIPTARRDAGPPGTIFHPKNLRGGSTPPPMAGRSRSAGRPTLHAILFLGLCTALFAQTQPAPETTPTELPGAETFFYQEEGPPPLRLFVVKPVGWQAGDRRPALLFFFGGGWTTGTPASSIFWARFAAGLGMVGIAPDYRTKGRNDVSPLGSVADGRAALHWVQEHAAELGLDPARIVVGGNSAGGHVALWTALTPAPPGSDEKDAPRIKPAALILFSAVSDTSTATGYTPQRFGTHTTALSPVHQLDAKMPPVLAFHGDADKTVPLRQAVALRDQLLAIGNVCELHIVPGGGHNFGNDVPEWREKSRELMIDFLKNQGLLD
jgi:acetyl esterase